MLSADHIDVARGATTILSGLSLSLQAGETVGVLGANGAGKSTFLAALADELPVAAGQVTLRGEPLRRLSHGQQARERAVLPQKPSLGFDLGVDEVVAMGAYPFPELTEAQIDALSVRVLELADVTHLAGRRYLTLSGGEQQRVQFARVLLQSLAAREAGDARYLLLDEPTSSLDPRHQHDLLSVASRLAREAALGVLVILHDVNLAVRWCDRLLLLSGGRALACGAPQDVLTAENLQEVYGIAVTLLPHPQMPGRPLVLFG